jgi:hypothetical protein
MREEAQEKTLAMIFLPATISKSAHINVEGLIAGFLAILIALTQL